MGAVVVVDLWENTRGETRSFVDLLDGVHATTSNAHGPAAFSPRLRCRLAVAARNESAAWRLPLVRACALALRVTRRGRVTRRPLLLDALENRLALLGARWHGSGVCGNRLSLSVSRCRRVSCHAAALSRRDTIFEGVVTEGIPRAEIRGISRRAGTRQRCVKRLKGGGGDHLHTLRRKPWDFRGRFSSREGRNLKNERVEWWNAR